MRFLSKSGWHQPEGARHDGLIYGCCDQRAPSRQALKGRLRPLYWRKKCHLKQNRFCRRYKSSRPLLVPSEAHPHELRDPPSRRRRCRGQRGKYFPQNSLQRRAPQGDGGKRRHLGDPGSQTARCLGQHIQRESQKRAEARFAHIFWQAHQSDDHKKLDFQLSRQ